MTYGVSSIYLQLIVAKRSHNSHGRVDVVERDAGNLTCFLPTLTQNAIQLFGSDSLHALLKGPQKLDRNVGEILLQLGVTLGGKMGLNLTSCLDRLAVGKSSTGS